MKHLAKRKSSRSKKRTAKSSDAKKVKKKLTANQEFEIMKLVFDKFLWIGFGLMVFGLYRIVSTDVTEGIAWLIIGVVVLFLFTWITVREYEVVAA